MALDHKVVILSFTILLGILRRGGTSDSEPIIEAEVTGTIAAFGDFDSDKLTDVFLIGSKGRSFSILRGYKNEPLLRNSNKNWSCTLPTGNERIVALMPSDFHGMAMMDVLVVTSTTSDDSTLSLYLVRGDKDSLNCSALSDPLKIRVTSQPLLFDLNGDMITDLLGSVKEESEPSKYQRYVWSFKLNATYVSKPLFGDSAIKRMNSNAFVDLNRDTIPDVFIDGEEQGEYWMNEEDGFPAKSPSVQLLNVPRNKGSGSSSFLDIGHGGNISHVKPFINSKGESTILMLKGWTWIEITPPLLDPRDNSTLTFVKEQRIDGLSFPMSLRSADFDGDGFFDFVTLMETKAGVKKIVILRNIPSLTPDIFPRSFEVMKEFEVNIPDGEEPVVATFFDFHEDGKPDLLINTIVKSNQTWRIHAVINTVMVDACFLKVMVASGLCYKDCSAIKNPSPTPSFEPGVKDSVAYGTNQPGPNICHELVDFDGYVRKACQGQLTSSAHFSLQMPYTIFGLGSWPNFVDTLSATIPSPNSSVVRSRTWTQIVPDAQVVLIPYPKELPSFWRSKLFLTPSDIVLSTLITLASICILLIVVIAFLHRKEILEDIAEHEEYKRHWPDSR